MKIPRPKETGPRRSATIAHDGSPICRTCDEPFVPLRIRISPAAPTLPYSEDCQSCKQKRRIRELRKARGW